ncbi:hepatocyte growth factor activator isoform X2 [Etheostoma spectabile]|uniref:hepatocyte growth factor activator isoform X2 n=1 Tax=Etheostoma spectabile TaxID=54343 RepID=UPI0013AEB544|nr:hepatocyte growth factor activator isoform X2 [Etheostoma spectabile]
MTQLVYSTQLQNCEGQDNTCRVSHVSYDQKQAEDSEPDRYNVTQAHRPSSDFWQQASPDTRYQQMQTFMMAYLILIFLPFVFSTRARILAGYETVISKEPYKESRKVLTTMGEECKFPFRQGGRIHHRCLTILSSKPWCSLTHNFDRDRQWGFCAPEKTQPEVFVHTSRRIPDPCRVNPCQHGGVCTLIPQIQSFECSCPERFTGRLCEQKKCYETLHLRHYDIGESWGRIHLRNVEQCTCVAGEIMCERVQYTMCRSNPCQNDGTCRLITSTDKEVCNCRRGYSGPYCSLASSRRIVPFNVTPGIKKLQPPVPPKKHVCGKKHSKRLSVARGRILGGTSALPGNHPWMAAIYIGESDFCAGTMVSSCWIVSAAHCFFRNPLKSQLRVVLGQQRFNVTGPNTRTFGVEKYIFPKQFSVFNPTLHDIVLIKLAKQDGRCVKRTPFIRPICLPDKSMTFPDGYCCTISGWGHMHEKAQGYSSLQEAGVRLIPHDTCRKPNVYGNHVTDDMLCAGLNGCVDACQGDSGGPLACSRDDVSFLYGIISWGEGCGRSQKPGVYTKVGNYIDWINSVIRHKPKAS